MAKIGINIKEGTVKNTPSQSIIGIDLGTTNSLVAIVKEGHAETLKDANGQNTLVPSVIHFNTSGGTDVGSEALRQLINDPSRTIASVKRLMGKSYSDLSEYEDRLGYRIIEDDEETLVRIEVDGNYYSPVELSALILKALKKRAEQHLNEIIEKAVITVPAYFNDSQRQATRDAGKLAGLDVLRIVNEPTAAALAYGIGLDPEVDECIAVYDLGGGTFDISILKIEQGIFDVLSTNGDTFLGGDDIDHAIADHWRSQHNLRTDNARLKHIAEEAKKSITLNTDFRTECDGTILTLTQEELKEICQPIIQKTLECCALALKDAKLELSDINKVVLVGGSTRLPIIKSAVSEFFEQPVYDELNPDEVVAQGAAIQADILAGNRKDLLLLDITPLSLGIETIGELMDVIVPRNTNIPISAAREYTTSVDGQSRLRVSVFQGERELVSDNRKLGEFILSDIPSMPAGIPKIRISFIIDANGILQVRAKELRSGVEQQVELKSQFGLSEQEMAEMLKSSILNADQDIATRALREAQVEGEQLLMSMAKFKEQHPELVKPSMEKIEALESRIIALINSGGKDEILAAIEELNSFTKPLAEIAMNEVISTAMKGTSIDQKDQE